MNEFTLELESYTRCIQNTTDQEYKDALIKEITHYIDAYPKQQLEYPERQALRRLISTINIYK